MSVMGTFAEQIRDLRKARRWNQAQLADVVGVTQPTVSRWEAGSEPEQEHLVKLATIFGKTTDELLGNDTVEVSFRVRVVGVVEAGAWREAVELAEPDQYLVTTPRPSAPSANKAFGLMVKGNSMNMVYPEGTILVCVKLLHLHRDLRDGDHVIAVRRRGDEVEATCKELVMQAGEPWLWPRSTDPRHQQPMPGFIQENSDASYEAEIYAVVIGSFIDRP